MHTTVSTVATNVIQSLLRLSRLSIDAGRTECHMDHSLPIAQDLHFGLVRRDRDLAVGVLASLTARDHDVEASNGVVSCWVVQSIKNVKGW